MNSQPVSSDHVVKVIVSMDSSVNNIRDTDNVGYVQSLEPCPHLGATTPFLGPEGSSLVVQPTGPIDKVNLAL